MIFKRLLLVLSAFFLAFSISSYAASTASAQHPSEVKLCNWVYVRNMTNYTVNITVTTYHTTPYTLSAYGYEGYAGYLDLENWTTGHVYAYTDDGYVIFDQDVQNGQGYEFYMPYGSSANDKSHPLVRQIQP
jgi:hypothetical protein